MVFGFGNVCVFPREMVYSCVMHTASLAGCKPLSYWSKALHLFYAGLYAFVLPLICWGAQATPGHPHARPHFVFTDPPVDHHLGEHVARTVQNVADWLATYADTAICGEHNPAQPLPAAATPQLPAGRSTPAQLVISSLVPLAMEAALLPLQMDGPGYSVWLVAVSATPFCTLIPTPPPR